MGKVTSRRSVEWGCDVCAASSTLVGEAVSPDKIPALVTSWGQPLLLCKTCAKCEPNGATPGPAKVIAALKALLARAV